MKVCVSVFGRFHAFYLARQLEERGHLTRLITTYPGFEVVKYGVPKTKVASLFAQELVSRAYHKLPAQIKGQANPQFWFHERFDRAASRRVPDELDLYVGWSSFSERGLKRAKARGAVTVLERCSSHIEFQRDILTEEAERYGVSVALPHPEIVAKELREYELADYIAIPSSFVRRTFLAKGIAAEKLIQVPYGVGLDAFAPHPKADKTFRVVFAGASSLRKGVQYLLQAWQELRLPDAELWIIGSKTPEVDAIFEKYAGCFRWIPAVPQSELAQLYSQCSVFAIASIEEGMAYVQAQAMACGLPLLCTPNTGGEDLITEGVEGSVVPIRDVEALKEKITWFHQNPKAGAAMGRAARLRVQQGLTWDDYGRKICAEYERVCQPREAIEGSGTGEV